MPERDPQSAGKPDPADIPSAERDADADADADAHAHASARPSDVQAMLRANTTGVLRHDELTDPIQYVRDAEGHLVIPTAPHHLDAVDTALSIPDEFEDALELQVTLMEISPDGPESDRWRIYHGTPDHPRFARCIIEAAKYLGEVFDGDAIVTGNDLRDDEPAICRVVNRERRERLRPICRCFASVDVQSPLLVGVDPEGFDVRAAFGIVRIQAIRTMRDRDDALEVFDAMAVQAAADEDEQRHSPGDASRDAES